MARVRLICNYTEIAVWPDGSIITARDLAIDESSRYDDVFVIEVNGIATHIARYGMIYRLELA